MYFKNSPIRNVTMDFQKEKILSYLTCPKSNEDDYNEDILMEDNSNSNAINEKNEINVT